MVTGIDLIKTQIMVAAGEKLPFTQADVKQQGCAIECRINAENPAKNFQPNPGLIKQMYVPGGLGVRFDSHAHQGYVVPPHYDSMIGKLIVHKPTRAEAIACMKRALDELRVEGIATTAPFHKRVLSHNTFIDGMVDTGFVERELLSSPE
jgi:acetyl-CoA carboxylase biotin carboxylase subunit